MPPLPRATCHECGRDVPTRVDGRLREHTRRPSGSEQCPASGLSALPLEEARRRLATRVHPEERPGPHPVAALFPMLGEAELRELADDIAEHGLIEPVVRRGDQVIDGRNRLAACELAGVEPEFREWEGEEADLVSWILSKNLHRRHLTTGQRSMVAARLKEMWANLPTPERPTGALRELAADALNVSPRSVSHAAEVLGSGDSELVAQVERGEVAVSAAARQLRPEAAPGRAPEGTPSAEAGGSSPPLPVLDEDAGVDLAARQLDQAVQDDARPRCGALHPVNGRPCEEPEGHVWSHAYVDPRHYPESRMWWWNADDRRQLPEEARATGREEVAARGAEYLRRRIGLLPAGVVPVAVARRELRDALGVRRLGPQQFEEAAQAGERLGWWTLTGDGSLLPSRAAEEPNDTSEVVDAEEGAAPGRPEDLAGGVEQLGVPDARVDDGGGAGGPPVVDGGGDPADAGGGDPDVAAGVLAVAPLPNDQRAPFDAYYTPATTALACVRFLRDRVIPRLPPFEGDPLTAIEPCVGGGAWVRAFHSLLNEWAVDRVDLDPEARGLELDRRRAGLHPKATPGRVEEDAMVGDWLDPLPAYDGFGGLRRRRWRICAGNRPYAGPIGPFVEACLARAQCVALLERETITGTETRLPWWLAHRPAFIVKVVPRPKWEGPGSRDTPDFADSVLVVWVAGHTGPTKWDWVDASGE